MKSLSLSLHSLLAVFLLIMSVAFSGGMVFCIENGGAIKLEPAGEDGNCSDCPSHDSNKTKQSASDCCFDVGSHSIGQLTATSVSTEKVVKFVPVNLAVIFYQIFLPYQNTEERGLISTSSDPTLARPYLERSVVLQI